MATELIRVGVFVNPPMSDECAIDDLAGETVCPNAGIASKFLASCLRFANLSYAVSHGSRNLGSFNVNTSSWSGLLGEVHRGEIDAIAMFTSYSDLRAAHFLYTQFFSEIRYVFLIKTMDVQPSQGAMLLIDGFSSRVWLALLITFSATLASLVFINWTSRRVQSERVCSRFCKFFSEAFWKLLRLVCLQNDNQEFGATRRRRNASGHFLIAFLSFFILILVNLYQNILFNQISTIAERPPFRSTDELVSLIGRKKLTLLTTSRDFIYFDYVNNSDHYHFKLVCHYQSFSSFYISRGLFL